jgi:hypothetical protein
MAGNQEENDEFNLDFDEEAQAFDEEAQAPPLATPETEKQDLKVLQLKEPEPKLTKEKRKKKSGGTKKRKSKKSRKSRRSRKARR